MNSQSRIARIDRIAAEMRAGKYEQPTSEVLAEAIMVRNDILPDWLEVYFLEIQGR